jgi:RNA 3'-terminal phosphate cyclase-like protein
VKQLKPIVLVEQTKVKRIRGLAYSTKVSPQMSNRMVDTSRKILTKYIPDVYIYTDSYKGANSGKSPGYGLSLVAESTNGVLYSYEYFFELSIEEESPETCARKATFGLLKEIEKGGCSDSMSMALNLLLMAVGPEDVGRLRVGSITPFAYLKLTQSSVYEGFGNILGCGL